MRHDFGYFEEEKLTRQSDYRLWRRIVAYVRPFWVQVLFSILLSLIISATSLALPYLVRQAVDLFITKTDLPLLERTAGLEELSFIFGGLILAGLIANFLQVILLEWTGQNIMHRMRQELFSHILGLNLRFFNRNPVGKLVTRLTNDIQNMHEMFTSVIITIFNDFIRIFGILIILFMMNWRLALIMTLIVPLMVINTVLFSRLARVAFRDIRTHLARINSFLQESLSGLAVIQIFGRQQHALGRFLTLNRRYFDRTIYQIKIFAIFMPMIELLNTFAVGVIIWYGGNQILEDKMTIGILVAFLTYMRLFFQPLRELSQKYSIVQSAIASAERIFQLLDTANSLPVAENPVVPATIPGTIRFEHVYFAYEPGQPVISDFTLTVNPGETLAIVGATGSGKSTLINLLERFYDPDAGRITIDGIDLKDLDRFWLRQNIGLVMQDVLLIPASLKDNILLDRTLDDAKLSEIIKDAQLTELIAKMDQGINTQIGEGGVNLSAGERQLLAFARVLARNPRVLVLDEATSNVDSQTEILIERAIARTLANRTGIVIAHRLSTIRRADRILVMERGRIVEQGDHDSLMADQGLYFKLQNLDNHNHVNGEMKEDS